MPFKEKIIRDYGKVPERGYMQKITIKKKVQKNGVNEQALYYVPALSLRNSDNQVRLLVPHPNGNDVMEFSTLAEAAAAIRKAGFEYKLPEGETVKEQKTSPEFSSRSDIAKLLFNKFKAKANDMNTSVVSSAITALAYLNNKNSIEIFISKLGEDNEKIRTAAIDALAAYQGNTVDRLIDTLSDSNWVARNSAITCLVKLSEYIDVEPEKILIPMINRIDDENPIVQANAIQAAGKIYKNIQT